LLIHHLLLIDRLPLGAETRQLSRREERSA
jgi:hypothetical protein